ncbi:MAG: type IX secretion system membrane protein PorP/SprF [Flavobacteriales bacterium]|nr:type IX secretion system membrane protein PorP/SprF [Flavobacteriales bacterium]MCB9446877.1 type IX secretion system membrane protein PorP/SprF [Flavobacteriales bacterium]
MKKLSVLLCLIGFLGALPTSKVFAQDPEFTQFYANPLYLNPAFAGTGRCPRIIMNYRNQWPAISGTYVTYSASYDQHIDVLQGGLGLLVLNDKAGQATYNVTHFAGMYSYQLNISRQFSVKVGFQGMYIQRKIDWDKLNFGDQIDPKYGFVLSTNETRPPDSRGYIDFSAGILGYSKKYFFGFAAHHLTEPDEAFITSGSSKLPMKYTAHAGALLPMDRGEESSISPNILFQKQGDFKQLNLGLYLSKGPLVAGLWSRIIERDALILVLGFQEGIVKFGYSYDVTISKLSNATAGAHEFSFQLQFECRPKKRKFRTISCPSF